MCGTELLYGAGWELHRHVQPRWRDQSQDQKRAQSMLFPALAVQNRRFAIDFAAVMERSIAKANVCGIYCFSSAEQYNAVP
eukprot:2626697-Rhodomonas_salina.1